MRSLDSDSLPPVVERDQWHRCRDDLLVREKAHTREGDALAAARRKLPMTKVAPAELVGDDGRVSLVDAFEGRQLLIAYCFMWHHRHPTDEQCEGCTFSMSQISDGVRTYLAERDVTFAVFCEGVWDEIAAYRDFMGWAMPWYSTAHALENPAIAGGGPLRFFLRQDDDVYLTYETDYRGTEVMDTTLGLLDRTILGRQEPWEDSPDGWPQQPMGWWRRDGRPVAQWLRTDQPVT